MAYFLFETSKDSYFVLLKLEQSNEIVSVLPRTHKCYPKGDDALRFCAPQNIDVHTDSFSVKIGELDLSKCGIIATTKMGNVEAADAINSQFFSEYPKSNNSNDSNINRDIEDIKEILVQSGIGRIV